jgi:hypothetical protein
VNIEMLTRRAVEYALGSIEDMQGPLIPFTFVLDANADLRERKLVLTRFASETLEEGLAAAQASIVPSADTSMYAIAWDGYATVDKVKYDAVLIETGESGKEDAAVHAQPYAATAVGLLRRTRKNRPVGPLLHVGSTRSRLAPEAQAAPPI